MHTNTTLRAPINNIVLDVLCGNGNHSRCVFLVPDGIDEQIVNYELVKDLSPGPELFQRPELSDLGQNERHYS